MWYGDIIMCARHNRIRQIQLEATIKTWAIGNDGLD